MTNEQKVERAKRVNRFLESEEWLTAWTSYREMLINIIETADSDEKAMDARRMLRAAGKVRSHLTTLIKDGEIATAEMAARKSNLRIA